jgi:2-polyprenyl-3-methyl-5-hydroxy-6-metoxy-1,4-benzoquinol methylase
MASDRLDAEKQWHEEFFRGRNLVDFRVRDSIRNRYLSPPQPPLFQLEMMYHLVGDLRGKRVLCYGCGDSNDTVLLALRGAQVWAIDLSEEATGIQQLMARANGVENCIHIACGAAEQLPFVRSSFDLVFGVAILHHLPDSLSAVAKQVKEVLKPDGQALFAEPISGSDILKKIRRITPVKTDLSPGERQLSQEDMQPFHDNFRIQTYHFRLFARLERLIPFEILETAPPWKRRLVYLLYWVDHYFLQIPAIRRFAGVAVFQMFPRF